MRARGPVQAIDCKGKQSKQTQSDRWGTAWRHVAEGGRSLRWHGGLWTSCLATGLGVGAVRWSVRRGVPEVTTLKEMPRNKQTNKQKNKQTPSSALCSADQPMFAQAFPFRACLLVCGRQHKGRGGCCVTDGFVRAACSKATRPSSGCARCSTRSTWTEAARSTRMRCAMDSSGWASRSRQAAMPAVRPVLGGLG